MELLCYISFIFHRLLHRLLNQLWFLTQYYLSTIFGNFIHNLYLVKDINLLFPRRSCSIGFQFPLESIHSVRKLNVVIFAPFYPRLNFAILSPFKFCHFIPWYVPHHLRQTPFRFIHRTYPSHSSTLLSANLSVRPSYFYIYFSCILFF